jgi:DNA-binding beta-propeller fold protein YncE
MTQRRLLSLLLLLFLVTLLAGCAPPPRQRVLWPVYPATPRIEWLGTYSSQDDFPKTGWQLFGEGILGKPELQFFKSPYGIVSDSQGKIYVADSLESNLLVYDLAAQTVEYYSEEPIFSRPAGLAIDAADNLYVVDSDVAAVLVFDKKRRPLRTIGAAKELQAPAYIAIDAPRARIYVSDPKANKIVVYDRFGKKAGEIGAQRGSASSGYVFSSPQGLAIDKAGNLYVAELLGARISVFDPQGNYLRSFGERGDAVHQFEAPKDLAFDSDGNLWVADARRAQIYTYSPAGVLLLATGTATPTSDPLGFSTPTAIFIAADDRIFVTDRLNRRFSAWRYFSERYLAEHPFTAEEQAYIREIGRKITVPPAVVEEVKSPSPGLQPPSP